MKKVITLIVLSAIFVSQCYAQGSTQSALNFISFTRDKQKITTELASQTKNEFKNHPEYGVRPFNAPCKDCYELLQNRDLNHRYFVKEGTDGNEFYQETAFNDLNYYDANGRLLTIDYRLKPTIRDGIFSASHQPFPVTINMKDKYTSILNAGKEMQVNRNISLSIKKADGTLISLGEPSWSDYTAGDDGAVVHNIYPGIDLELHLGDGKVESFYRINKPLGLEGASLVIHDNVLLPKDFVYDFSYTDKRGNDLYEGTLGVNDAAGTRYYMIGTPAAFDENGREKDYFKGLQFGIDKNNGYDLYIPISWMNDPNRSYPILIDPMVTATSTLPVASITGSGYNATCFATGCTYNLGVAVPAATTITDITTTFWFRALGTCWLSQGAWDLTTGTCRFPTSGNFNTCNINLPGLCQLTDLSCFNNVKTCITPQCQAYNIPFVLTFYRCISPGTGCGFSCITVDPNTPWSMTVKGYKMNAYTSSVAICQGSKATLTASADSGIGNVSFKWYPGGLSGATVQVSPASTTTYTVTASDCNGLDSAQAFALVSVAPNDNPGFTIAPNPACPGQAVTITGLGSRPLTSYDWMLPGGNPAVKNDTKSFSVTYATAGTYSITLRDSSNECVFDSTLTISIINNTATAGPDTSVCAGSNVTLHATGGTSFTWMPGNLSGQNVQVNPTATTTYTVTASTNGNCSATATVTVTIKGGITVSITPSGPTTFCQGGSVTLTANGGVSWVWGNTATTQAITVNGSGTYSVVGTDAGGCTGSATTTVTVNQPPTITITAGGPTTVCQGGSVVFTAHGGVSYSWSTGSTANPITVTTTTTVSVTGTDQNGCTGTATASATVNPNPTVTITASGPTSFCQGGSVNLTANGAAQYVWSTTATTNPITVNTTGNYSVTGTDQHGCTGTATQSVTVNPLPTVTIAASGPIDFCDGDSVTLTGSGATSFKWSPNGETTNSIVVKQAGTYSAVGTDGNGCSGTSNTITVTVSPKGTVTIDPVPPICLTSPAVTLTATPTGGTFSGPGVVGNTFDPSITGVGTFTITYTYTGGGSCLSGAVDTVLVTVSPQATVTIDISPTIGCLNHTIYYGYGPQDVTLTANSTSIITSYQWYMNGAPVAGATNKTFVTNLAGWYNVIVTVPGGCPSDSGNTTPALINVVDVRCGKNNQKVILCHVPPGDTLNPQTICIAPSAVPAHIENHPGDCLGPCTFKKNPQSNGHHHLRMAEDIEETDDMIMVAYPNPFSSVTTLEFERTVDNAHMLVEVYTLTGEKIVTLFDKDAEAGITYTAQFDGSKLASGVYIYRVTSGDKVTNGKMVLIK